MTTRPSLSHDEIRGPTLSERGILRTRACASCSSAAMTATGRAWSGMRHRGLWLGGPAFPLAEAEDHPRHDPAPDDELVETNGDGVSKHHDDGELRPQAE